LIGIDGGSLWGANALLPAIVVGMLRGGAPSCTGAGAMRLGNDRGEAHVARVAVGPGRWRKLAAGAAVELRGAIARRSLSSSLPEVRPRSVRTLSG
jgi:hypothetical protein